jgi:hypothetical protein
MPGIDYKISLDTPGFNSGLKAVNGVHSATSAFGALLRGDFVSAAVQARGAMVALRAAMLANPYLAVASALLAVGSAFAAVMWKRRQQEIEDLKRATEDLADATARYSRTVNEIAFKGAAPEKQIQTLQLERDSLQANTARLDIMSGESSTRLLTPSARQKYLAEIDTQKVQNAQRVAEIDAQIAELQEKIAADTAKEAEEARKVAEAKEERMAGLDSRRKELTEQLWQGGSYYTPEQHARDLQDESIRLAEEQRSLPYGDERRAQLEVEMLEKQVELQQVLQGIERQRAAEADAKGKALGNVKQQEAQYAFSKLSPEEQLSGINARAREIMGKKGWEGDAEARAEMLRLRQARDEIVQKQDAAEKKASATAGRAAVSVSEVSPERLFDNYYGGRGADSVLRMSGSMAGGFADRLRPSAFARTRAELDARRAGRADAAANAVTVHGADEKPVELAGPGLNYLRVMADALTKEA